MFYVISRISLPGSSRVELVSVDGDDASVTEAGEALMSRQTRQLA
jgi:hypothetical protein